MKKGWFVLTGVILGVLIAFGSIYIFSNSVLTAGAQSVPGGDENPSVQENNSPALNGPSLQAESVTPVYFLPQDSNGTATVLFLYNTTNVEKMVNITSYDATGSVRLTQNVTIPPMSLRRCISDYLSSPTPQSWVAPISVIVNFTDFSYFAVMDLPAGVKADGYILYNNDTGLIDPNLDQGAVPLRFSTDPATVFLPTVQR
ncbi:MAG: hypothetical protein ACYC3P_12785 [Bellilinea sp.]